MDAYPVLMGGMLTFGIIIPTALIIGSRYRAVRRVFDYHRLYAEGKVHPQYCFDFDENTGDITGIHRYRGKIPVPQ